jgi:hypothetical protein
MNTPNILSETLELPALDGYPLTATLYHAPEPMAQLLIAGATGVPQGFSCRRVCRRERTTQPCPGCRSSTRPCRGRSPCCR